MNNVERQKTAEELAAIADHLEEIRFRMVDGGGDDESTRILARRFARLDDDQQAKFFVEVARHMNAWGPGKLYWQASSIGEHLRTCECATEEARDLVRSIARATEPA